MDWDDIQKKPVKAVALGESLETLAIAELVQRIAALQNEIERVEAELEKKRAHEQAAAALFKR